MSTAVFPANPTTARVAYDESDTAYRTCSATWTHPGAEYTVQGLSLSFVCASRAYKVKTYENGSYLTTYSGNVAAGTTVTLPLGSSQWEGKNGGTLELRFFRSWVLGDYNTIQLVMTYEQIADKSTAVVVETEAGQPQTVAITNSSDTVQHRVTWSYENGTVTHGPVLYGAATRYPAWAVPAEDLEDLYEAVTDRAYLTGTVTVETLTADGTSLGSVTCDARLRIPDSVGPTLTVSTQLVHDAVAQAVNAGSQTEIIVQGHTTITITPTAAAQYTTGGASLALMTYRTPAGGIACANTNPTTVPLTTAGSWALQVTATDSRGLARTVEVQLTVAACEAPRITALDAKRWSSGSSSGHQDEEGVYAQVLAEAQITSLASGASWTYELTVSGSSTALETGNLTLDGNGFGYIGGTMSPDSAYTVTVTVTDSLGQSSSASAEIPTALYTIHFLQGGKGVALGKQAEYYGLDINSDWPIRIHGQRLEEYMLDRLYPVGNLVLSADMSWDPMGQWPWTEWGRLADTTVDGITMAQWVRGR